MELPTAWHLATSQVRGWRESKKEHREWKSPPFTNQPQKWHPVIPAASYLLGVSL